LVFKLFQLDEKLRLVYKATTDGKLAYKATADGKFSEALRLFLAILHTIPVIGVDSI